MEYIIEHFQTQSTVFMRRTGAYGSENFVLMASLKEWAANNGLLEGSTIYGIAYDGPETPPEQCRYDVCLATEVDCTDDGAVQSGQIPGGKYAVFTVLHTTPCVEQFWQNIFDVLQQNSLALDTVRPILERYQYDIVKQGKCEFCVPIT